MFYLRVVVQGEVDRGWCVCPPTLDQSFKDDLIIYIAMSILKVIHL